MSDSSQSAGTNSQAQAEQKMTPQNILHLVIVCCGITLYALNNLITSTLLPSAVSDLQGINFINWSALVYSTAAIIFSLTGGSLKTSLGGRKTMIIAGLVFTFGALLVSQSSDMIFFLFARAIQGAGGGLILATCYTVIGDLFARHHWPKVFAWESAVWAVASLTGPLAGGFFAQTVGWRLAFYLIAGSALLFVVAVRLCFPPKARLEQETITTSRKEKLAALPILRLIILVMAISSIAIAGLEPDWSLPLLGVAFLLLLLLLQRDKLAKSPLLPREGINFTTPAGTGLLVIFLASVSTYSFVVYGPYLLQTVHGLTPLNAGYLVAWESMSWSIAAMICARISQTVRWRPLLIPIGIGTSAIGLYGISLFLFSGPLWLLTVAIFFAGAGFGIFWADLSSRIIESGPSEERDRRSGAIPTVLMCGGAFGPALAGIPAQMAGFSDTATLAVLEATAYWVHIAFVPLVLLSLFLSFRVIRPRATSVSEQGSLRGTDSFVAAKPVLPTPPDS
ncbi:MFS transporter [Kiloniella laminariae]|uniref:MFS transporter n=1 Tax=Kiloniella laminariae TaxID=454162 RepID=UPI00037B3397|nr:MFS transporter [Kiloniella laminariae]